MIEIFILILFFGFLYLLGDESIHKSYDEDLERKYDMWEAEFKRKHGK